MRFALIHKSSSYLMVATGFAAAFFGGEVHELVGLLFSAALIASWWWEPPRVDLDKLTRWWNLATIAALVWTLVSIFALEGDLILDAFHFLTFLQVNKMLNRRTSKDYLHSYVLSFLMLTLATTVNTELNYGLWFVLYLVFTTWTLILFHLKREMEDNYLLKHSEDASRSRKVEIQRILNSRRIVGVPFLAATSGISVIAFLMALMAFFIFPRVGFGLFFANRRMGNPVAGFSDRVELGDFGVIKDDPSIVMRVEMEDAATAHKRMDLRWRGNAYDLYDGRSWLRSSHKTKPLTKWNGKFWVRRGDAAGQVTQKVYLEPIDTKFLFALGKPASVEIQQGPRELPQGAWYEVKLDRFGALLLDITSTLKHTRLNRWTDPDKFVSNPAIRYSVVSDLSRPPDKLLRERDSPLDPQDPGVHRRAGRWFGLPAKLDPRVRELALSWTTGLTTTVDKARAIERHLREDFKYTTDLEQVDTTLTPLDDFLFVRKEGHCEYFATAMAVMMRSLGLPARYVQGFYGGHYNRFGDYLAISHGDAHSWVEVYFNGVEEWVTFDPTPAASGPNRRRAGLWWTLSMYADALRLKWFRYVIEYDLNKQFEAVRKAARWFPRVFAPPRAGSRGEAVDIVRRIKERPGALLGLIVLLLLIGGVVGAYLRQRRRGSHRGRGGRSAIHRSSRLYERLLRLLERRGHSKNPSDTALEFLRRVERKGSQEEAEVTREVTGRYLSARFGDEPLTDEEEVHLSAQVKRLAARPRPHPPNAPAQTGS